MDKKVKTGTAPKWNEVKKRVVEEFDLDEVGCNYGVSRWLKQVENVRAFEDAGEIKHSFTSPKVIDAVVESCKADIEENIAIYKRKLAQNNHLLKMRNLTVILGEAQGVFVDEKKGEQIVPELLAVTRVTKSAKTKMMKQVVEASISLASNNGDEGTEQPNWPTGLGDWIQLFADDLSEFIAEYGEEGCEMVQRICEDIEYAKRVCEDEELPHPIRVLSRIVLEIHSNNNLPKDKRAVGFELSSQ